MRKLIHDARQQALRAVDTIQIRTCWEIGHHIVEFEQDGTTDFGKGFDASNLYKMNQFYRLFPKLDALRLELSWTHYRLLLRVEDATARWICMYVCTRTAAA